MFLMAAAESEICGQCVGGIRVMVDNVATGEGESEHFSIVRRGASTFSHLDVGDTLVRMCVPVIVNKLILAAYAISAPDIMYSCSGAAILVGLIAKIQVESNAVAKWASAICHSCVLLVDIPDEAEATFFIQLGDRVGVCLKSRVF